MGKDDNHEFNPHKKEHAFNTSRNQVIKPS